MDRLLKAKTKKKKKSDFFVNTESNENQLFSSENDFGYFSQASKFSEKSDINDELIVEQSSQDNDIETFYNNNFEIISPDQKLIVRKLNSIDDEFINIVLSGDSNVSLSLAVLIKSIILNCNNYLKLKIYIICDNPYYTDFYINLLCQNLLINERLKDRIDNSSNTLIKYIVPSDYLINKINLTKSFHSKEYDSKPTSDFNFIRFYFDRLLPDSVNKVIYLDNDMVVKQDIQILFDSLTPDYDVGVCYPTEPYKLKKEYWICNDFLLSKFKKDYLFNAGMYIFYKKSWKFLKKSEKCINIVLKNKERKLYEGGTQSVLNLICDNVLEIDKKWNQTGLSEGQTWDDSFDETIKLSNIIHYTGFYKPWIESSDNFIKCNYLEEWFVNFIDINTKYLRFNDYIYSKINDLLQKNTDNFKELTYNFRSKLKGHILTNQIDKKIISPKPNKEELSKSNLNEINNITQESIDNKLEIKITFNKSKNMEEVPKFLSVNLIEDNRLKVLTGPKTNQAEYLKLKNIILKETIKAKFNKKKFTVTIKADIKKTNKDSFSDGNKSDI